MEASDELQAFLTKATQDGVWGRLLDRGAAWSIMRQAGVLPEDAPPLGEQIDIDLAEHGFSILRAALSLRELDGTSALCQRAFERAGNARIVFRGYCGRKRQRSGACGNRRRFVFSDFRKAEAVELEGEPRRGIRRFIGIFGLAHRHVAVNPQMP